MITAKEAAEISGLCADDYLKFLEEKIKGSAQKKARSVYVREKPYATWIYGQPSDEEKKAIKILRENGFSLEQYVKHRPGSGYLDDLDVALIIRW